MVEESQPEETHAARVQRSGRKQSSRLPADSQREWPLTRKELLDWYSHEVEDIQKSAQLRIREATTFVMQNAKGEISLEEAGDRYDEYSRRWGQVFPGGIERVGGTSDEEIHKTMDEAAERMKRLYQKGREPSR